MRGVRMARLVIIKIDRFINYLTLSVAVCGSMIIHLLTALTLQSYYGSPWGYVSFLLPGISEIYLCTIQISESMYNYMMLLTAFISVISALGIVCFIKNVVKSRVAGAFEG